MEISKLVHLLEEAINQKIESVEALSRQCATERSLLANDIKQLNSLIQKHASMLSSEKDNS